MTRSALILLAACVAGGRAAMAQNQLWMRQFGTSGVDIGRGAALDAAGNMYVTGYTQGALGGPSAGNWDVFLAKYNASGSQLWKRQFGTTGYDWGYGVAADGAGNAYVTGYTEGDLGGINEGERDAFLAKYDPSGVRLWVRQLGNVDTVQGYGVAVDRLGNAFITGTTIDPLGGPSAGGVDAFLAKYDASGAQLWVRQVGTPMTHASRGVAVDAKGNAFITGWTAGSLGAPNSGQGDVFLVKFDSSGSVLWTRQLGTGVADFGNGVAVDGAGNAYIAGYSLSSFGGPTAGSSDAILIKYDPSGTLLWMRQVGTGSNDYCDGLAVDGAGNAYLTGTTLGNFGGGSGAYDAFLIKYDASGALKWTRQFGSGTNDRGYGVAADGAGNAYVTGSLGGPIVGNDDAFLVKYGPNSCYPNCDGSTGSPLLTAADFVCFTSAFAAGSTSANCDQSTVTPVLTANDFQCFVNAFAAGCP